MRRTNILLLFGLVTTVAVIIIGVMFLKTSVTEDFIEAFKSDQLEQSAIVDGRVALPGVSVEDHILGAQNASVIWIEYGDFECAFCGKLHPVTQQMVAEYPNDVQFIYRHFPLSIHQLARTKAIASECVAGLGGEGAFWEYHDMLFDRAGATGADVEYEDLAQFAVEVGVNENTFSECLTSGEYDAKVDGDTAGGFAAGISSTPTSVVIGPDGSATILEGALSFQQIQAVIDYLLQQ